MIVYLFDLAPWNKSTDAADALYLSSPVDHETAASHTPASRAYRGLVTDWSLVRAAVRPDGALGGTSVPGGGSITIRLPDDWKASGRLAELHARAWDGWGWTMTRLATATTDPAAGVVVGSGTMAGFRQTGPSTAVIDLYDRAEDMRAVMQTSFYTGAGGFNGGADLEGKPKPLTFGEVNNVPAVMVDAANRWLDLHDGQIEAVNAVRDNGVALSSSGSNPPPSGSYYVDLANGRIRLGVDPVGEITADVEGAKPAGTYHSTVSAIAQYIVQTWGGVAGGEIDTSAWSAVASARTGVAGVHLPPVPIDLSTVLDQLMTPLGWWGFSRTDQFTGGVLEPATATSATHSAVDKVVTAYEVVAGSFARRPLGRPPSSILIEFDTLGATQSADALGGSVSAANRLYYSTPARVSETTIAGVATDYPRAKPLRLASPMLAAVGADEIAADVAAITLGGASIVTFRIADADDLDRGGEVWIDYEDFGFSGVAGRILTVEDTRARAGLVECLVIE